MTEDNREADSFSKQMAIWEEAAKDSFWGFLGAELQSLENGTCIVYLDLQRHHMNLIGILHGGVYATLIDSAMGMVAMAAHPQSAVVTTNLNLNYVSPIKEGRLVVKAEIVHQSRKMISTQAYAHTEQGDLCAFGTGTFRVLGK